jgi:hypothetical protein
MVRLLQKRQKTTNTLIVFAVGAFSLHILLLLFLLIQGIKIRQLAQRQPPNFVELIAGKQANFTDNLSRDPESIKQFIAKIMTLMFNWTGTLPAQRIEEIIKPQLDPGILIITPKGGSKRVTTSSWLASFAFSEDFRQGFLSEIASMTPPEVFLDNRDRQISAQLIIKRINLPEKIAPGKWRVSLVADLIQKIHGKQIIIPFNKDILIRATDYYSYVLPEKASSLQQAIYDMRSNKLEIYEMRNICLLDSSNSCYNATN